MTNNGHNRVFLFFVFNLFIVSTTPRREKFRAQMFASIQKCLDFFDKISVRIHLDGALSWYPDIFIRPSVRPSVGLSPSQPLGLESRSFWITYYSLPVSTFPLRGILLMYVNRNTCCPIWK